MMRGALLALLIFHAATPSAAADEYYREDLRIPMAAAGPLYATTRPMALRYSGRLGDVTNVEVRAAGPVNTSELGDSLIVVTASGLEVRIALRPRR